MDGTPIIPSLPVQRAGNFEVQLGIGSEELVLEVGGGHNPLKRANVIADIDFYSGIHRDGMPIQVDSNRFYVQGDIANLPFSDKAFDWVICFHVLEHVENPQSACDELMRVAEKGFIEVPRKWTEYFAGHPAHRWLIDLVDNALVFEPVNWIEHPFINFALPPVWNSGVLLKRVEEDFRHIPAIQFVWQGDFRYVVLDESAPGTVTDSTLAMRHFQFARNILYWGGEPERGFFHAEQAYNLARDHIKIRKLYGTYLVLTGRLKEAAGLGLGVSWFVRAVYLALMLKVKRSSEKNIFKVIESNFWL